MFVPTVVMQSLALAVSAQLALGPGAPRVTLAHPMLPRGTKGAQRNEQVSPLTAAHFCASAGSTGARASGRSRKPTLRTRLRSAHPIDRPWRARMSPHKAAAIHMAPKLPAVPLAASS